MNKSKLNSPNDYNFYIIFTQISRIKILKDFFQKNQNSGKTQKNHMPAHNKQNLK